MIEDSTSAPVLAMRTDFIRPVEPSLLLLAHLAPVSAEGIQQSRTVKELAPLFSHRLSMGDWRRRFDALCEEAIGAGWVTRIGRARLRLKEAGTARVAEILPGAEKAKSWAALRDRHLVGTVLGVPLADKATVDAIATADKLRALILVRAFDLSVKRAAPSLAEVYAALAWKAFERLRGKALLPEMHSRKLTASALIQVMLNDLGGLEQTAEKALSLNSLAMQAVGAPRIEAGQLRLRLLQRAVDAVEIGEIREIGKAGEAGEAGESEATVGIDRPVPDLPAFAETVKKAARRSQTGWFGDRKIFISHVWKQMTADSQGGGLDLEGFKQWLFQAYMADLLKLARADLVTAMDPQDVRESRILEGNAEWNFLVMD